MSKEKKLIFIASLMLVAASCSSCSTAANYNNCPQFPIGGEKVATELENMPYDDYKNTWEWLGRLNKLKQELDICQ